jgi:hypothetical protein
MNQPWAVCNQKKDRPSSRLPGQSRQKGKPFAYVKYHAEAVNGPLSNKRTRPIKTGAKKE